MTHWMDWTALVLGYILIWVGIVCAAYTVSDFMLTKVTRFAGMWSWWLEFLSWKIERGREQERERERQQREAHR